MSYKADQPPPYGVAPQHPQAAYQGGYPQQQPQGPYGGGPPNQGGYYQGNPNMGYHQQQQGPPQGYYPPQQGYYPPQQGGYPPPQGYYPQQRQSNSDGCMGALLGALACCCCLDCLF
ncbi:Uu.00g017030.m01.CDS01 [Anthostomella pinea]|uniref:Uu.00g017030.m01.CDS01 n=1 Tax=Anthostomella pinea TaxID=933095 RepID=A0AAI8VYT4_9PEZI|nr:Uu.00g017030.m01.CDS01 [Anthostomella pinea]